MIMEVENEKEKAKSVQSQLRIWEGLLEIRMRMQKLLMNCNKLPTLNQDDDADGFGPEKSILADGEAQSACKSLLNQLLELQKALLMQNPETSRIIDIDGVGKKRNIEQVDDGDLDEEITSESEPEEKEDQDQDDMNDNDNEEIGDKIIDQVPSKKRKRQQNSIDHLTKIINERNEGFKGYRDQTIQKWNEKTQISSITPKDQKKGNFSSFHVSTLKQIGHILADRPRLLKRTQIQRSDYTILQFDHQKRVKNDEKKVKNDVEKSLEGSEEEEDNNDIDDNEDDIGTNKEIFDDDDFYHSLLREMVERKTTGITDPVEISRSWLELQKVRSKLKRKVDTRASKGRKIRYDVHSKLVNFMAPRDDSKMSESAVRELFSSIFGSKSTTIIGIEGDKNQKVDEESDNIFTSSLSLVK